MLSPRNGGRCAFVPFVVAADPSLEVTRQMALALIDEGADSIELGVPFSDALADGPVIQAASERACRTSLADVLELVAQLSARHPQVPLILFSYLNPILRMGFEPFAERARRSGAAAALVVDLPVEESLEHQAACSRHGLKTVFLAAPTTSNERLSKIGEASTGFVYCVSRAGITGERSDLAPRLTAEIARVKQVTRKPVAVGFGISTAALARTVAMDADAVVVGSAFVRLIAENGAAAEGQVRALARALKAATRLEAQT
jgi:tryptophan synthase alpha chain